MALETDLEAYYKLDTDNATQPDATGNNTGTVAGTCSYSSSGLINGCYSFPGGTSNYIDTGYNCSGLTEVSISLWANMGTALVTPCGPISDFSAPGAYIRHSDGLVGFTLNGSNVQSTGISWTANTWIHVVLTYSSGTSNGKKAYLNGALVAQGTQTGAIAAGSNLTLGRRNSSSFLGTIDEAGVWSRVLTPTEITTLYGGGSGYSSDNFIIRAPQNYLKARQRDRSMMFNISERVK